jgi:hypothetical protein
MPRPFGVTLVGILVIIAGISYVISGILGIFNADLRASVGLLSIIVVLVLGLIYLAVAKGLFDGNSFSRFLVGTCDRSRAPLRHLPADLRQRRSLERSLQRDLLAHHPRPALLA